MVINPLGNYINALGVKIAASYRRRRLRSLKNLAEHKPICFPQMNKGKNNRFSRVWVVIRIFIGCLFVVSGFEKLIGPYQNFLYVVQNYEFLNPVLEDFVARGMPWVELLTGVFLVVGLWLKWALRAGFVLWAMFIFVVGQALVRNLPVTECGCFGELISFPLPVILMFDSCLLLLTVWLMKRSEKTSRLSLDHYFLKQDYSAAP